MTDRGSCDEFAVGRYPELSRLAVLLTQDATAAQDLVQETLIRVIQKWQSVRRADDPDAYVRKMMLNQYLAGRRRLWHREGPVASLPDHPAADDGFAGPEARDELRRALAALPARQRAAVILRHYEERSEVQTAELLGCSVGTVKSLSSRGLAALRVRMAADRSEAG